MTLQEAADAYASACNEVTRALQSKDNAQGVFEEARLAADSAMSRCSMAKSQLIAVAAAGVEGPAVAAATAPKREPRIR
jgi:hypothetical protein